MLDPLKIFMGKLDFVDNNELMKTSLIDRLHRIRWDQRLMCEGSQTELEEELNSASLDEVTRQIQQLIGDDRGDPPPLGGGELERMQRALECLVKRLNDIVSSDPVEPLVASAREVSVVERLELMQRELRASRLSQRFSDNVIEGLGDGILVVDLDERVIRTNAAFRNLSGYEDDEILGRPANIFFYMQSEEEYDIRGLAFDNRPHMPSHFFQRLARKGGRHEFFLFTKDGGAKPIAVTSVQQRSRSGQSTGYICSVLDISAQVRQERNLHRLALHDGLTGLPNRRAMEDVLAREWKAGGRSRSTLSVLMIDVDRFKPYNDHYGHLDGDELLRRIAKVVGSSVRRPRDLAARYGGEEFIVVLPETEQDGAEQVAENIRTSVIRLKARAAPGGSRFVTVSVGVASIIPTNNLRAEELVEAADTCLYQAKSAGRNRVNAITMSNR